jgi:hypothetical protein
VVMETAEQRVVHDASDPLTHTDQDTQRKGK